MADAVVSFAVERLGDLLISESKLLYGVRDQINELQIDLKRMHNFLQETEKKPISDERVRGWVKEIKELAFKTEDVIEIFALQVATGSGFKGALRRLACTSSQLISRHNVAMEISDIKAKLASINQNLPTYGITKGLEEGQTSNSQVNQRISFPHDVEKDFIGMEKEIEQLVTNLRKEDKGTGVVSIWGMGGQGKTTLAQRLYNHVDIRVHFKAFAWVCISQQFDRKKVLEEILKQLLPDDRAGVVSNMGVMELVDQLRKVQQEKNCLVVIDDIWTIESWKLLEPAFPLEKTTSGSKILLTTRHLTVAEIGSVCKISGLTEDEDWKLLSKKARIYDQPDIRMAPEMERIGRKMVNKCEGLPLAISTLGGLLKGKHLLREWEKINEDITFYLAKGEGVTNVDEYRTVRQVLGLSYDNLPSRLRHCFLCFANYKEDEIIETEELYLFWMAEGLISVEDKANGEMMLDVAERYLDELAHRSLVKVKTQDAEGDSWSKYKECGVHDLIHDLCFSKVKEEGVINVIDLERKVYNEFKGSIERRLCVRSYDGKKDVFKPYEQREISHIRSLFIWNILTVVLPDKIFRLEKYKLLRVLTARGYRFSEQHIRSISELVYLKYLCLRYCEVNILPTSIGKLRNLETLDLRTSSDDDDSLSIPNVVWKLKMLKHLYLPFRYEVRGRGKKLRLEGLNELQLVHNFDSDKCEARDLLGLPILEVFIGKIAVEENITSEDIAEFAKSRKLRHTDIGVKGREVSLLLLLECCFIDMLGIGSREIDIPMYVFPKANSYHGSYSGRLTSLDLNGFRMEEDPMILLQKIPNLRSLRISKSEYLGGGEIVWSAMSFLKLERLVLGSFKGLRGWRVEEGAMPNLLELLIRECLELEMLPEGLIHLTSLKNLWILDMSRTFTDKIRAIGGVKGQDFYKVRHIPNIDIF